MTSHEMPKSDALRALQRIRGGDPEVVQAAWWHMPSAYHIDTMDQSAMLEWLNAVVDAALQVGQD